MKIEANEYPLIEKANHRLIVANRELTRQLKELYELLEEKNDKISKLEQTPSFSNVSELWVSVKDRLPEKDQTHYMGFSPKYGIWFFYFSSERLWYDLDWRSIHDITHWMERPPKPIDA